MWSSSSLARFSKSDALVSSSLTLAGSTMDLRSSTSSVSALSRAALCSSTSFHGLTLPFLAGSTGGVPETGASGGSAPGVGSLPGPVMFVALIASILLMISVLIGCGTTPTALDRAVANVQTNYTPVLGLQTNVVTVFQTNVFVQTVTVTNSVGAPVPVLQTNFEIGR